MGAARQYGLRGGRTDSVRVAVARGFDHVAAKLLTERAMPGLKPHRPPKKRSRRWESASAAGNGWERLAASKAAHRAQVSTSSQTLRPRSTDYPVIPND